MTECKGRHPTYSANEGNTMKAAKTQRVHKVGSGYHWAISVNKAGCCPVMDCAAPNGQPCVNQPNNTVHVARVRALGHGVR